MTDYGSGERCQALNGACVDAFVTAQVLAALAPASAESRVYWAISDVMARRLTGASDSWRGA
ncbi:hypothetical protein HEP84_58425 [Streptomyces sp. RLB1-33]|nr:hypothetical protein [Streptomyces sp. RLB1-33]